MVLTPTVLPNSFGVPPDLPVPYLFQVRGLPRYGFCALEIPLSSFDSRLPVCGLLFPTVLLIACTFAFLKIKKGASCRSSANWPLIWCLGEQTFNLLGDAGDDRIIEDEGQSRQEQRTQNYGDNDFDGVRNVKIAALIGQCHTAAVEQIVGFGIDMGREFSHG